MDQDIWAACPSTTNAVERRNKDCKSDTPDSLKSAVIKVYKVDKVACLKHIAAEIDVSLSYRSTTEEARREATLNRRKQKMNSVPDKTALYGLPNRASNFIPCNSSRI